MISGGFVFRMTLILVEGFFFHTQKKTSSEWTQVFKQLSQPSHFVFTINILLVQESTFCEIDKSINKISSTGRIIASDRINIKQ